MAKERSFQRIKNAAKVIWALFGVEQTSFVTQVLLKTSCSSQQQQKYKFLRNDKY